MSAHANLAPLAETLADFAGRHRGATILVCGCGPSLKDLPVRPGCISIGVNDVGRPFDPDYLVVVNPPAHFRPERRQAITDSRARAVFTQYPEWRLQHAPRVPHCAGVPMAAWIPEPEPAALHTELALCCAMPCNPHGRRAHGPDRAAPFCRGENPCSARKNSLRTLRSCPPPPLGDFPDRFLVCRGALRRGRSARRRPERRIPVLSGDRRIGSYEKQTIS